MDVIALTVTQETGFIYCDVASLKKSESLLLGSCKFADLVHFQAEGNISHDKMPYFSRDTVPLNVYAYEAKKG